MTGHKRDVLGCGPDCHGDRARRGIRSGPLPACGDVWCHPELPQWLLPENSETPLGEVDIGAPQNRKDTFEPKIIGKFSWNVDGMEEKILALYAYGIESTGHR